MNFNLIVQTLFLCFFSLVLAGMETQIEGAAGWAQNLPTWRPDSSKWISRFYGKIMGGKALTLYHVLFFTLVVVCLHYPYFSGKFWSLGEELTTLSLLLLVMVTEDFLWFVINPKYNFGRFLGQRVLWHKKWFLHLPIEYWFAFPASALLYVRFVLNRVLFKEWLEVIALFFIFILIVMFFAVATGTLKVKEEFKS